MHFQMQYIIIIMAMYNAIIPTRAEWISGLIRWLKNHWYWIYNWQSEKLQSQQREKQSASIKVG